MRQLRLRSALVLIGIIALSLWIGMRIERARSVVSRRTVVRTVGQQSYTIMRPTYQRRTINGKAVTIMRPTFEKVAR